MCYEEMDQKFTQLRQIYKRICIKPVAYTKKMPVVEAEMEQLEKQVHTVLPTSFKGVFLTVFKEINFKAFLPEHLILPEALKEVFCAEPENFLEEV